MPIALSKTEVVPLQNNNRTPLPGPDALPSSMRGFDSKGLLIEVRDSALWVTLNRPAAMNGLTLSMLSGLDAALDDLEADPSLRCMVLTGSGRALCAGADLKGAQEGFGEADPNIGSMRFTEAFLRLTIRMERLDKPIIAAVNGIAVAGGLELVLACDLVFAARSAQFGDAHANYGLMPGAGSSVRLTQ
ncbi:MAG: enoyl-CoA hydratase/isomerase family protein, partial [Alcaligenaceae bacterium]